MKLWYCFTWNYAYKLASWQARLGNIIRLLTAPKVLPNKEDQKHLKCTSDLSIKPNSSQTQIDIFYAHSKVKSIWKKTQRDLKRHSPRVQKLLFMTQISTEEFLELTLVPLFPDHASYILKFWGLLWLLLGLLFFFILTWLQLSKVWNHKKLKKWVKPLLPETAQQQSMDLNLALHSLQCGW